MIEKEKERKKAFVILIYPVRLKEIIIDLVYDRKKNNDCVNSQK
jgi:hypothetical protein